MRASSSTSSLTSIDRLALVLHLHHRGRTLLAPAVCPLSPSSSSATLPHPHRNVAIRRPACVRPPRPLTSIDRFALVLHLHHRGVTSGLGLEQNGLLHRSARHHMLLLIFRFSLAFVVILIASRSTQHTLQTVTQDTTLPPRCSRMLPFSPLFRRSFM
ncbi:hypothetical protein BGY98DRAFT_1192627 [Russula aff. rugulosa BPL654]|nr:hypothetical protein BGY98DRAFT_1192627 [Russula aff. rugulosa BPL654]